MLWFGSVRDRIVDVSGGGGEEKHGLGEGEVSDMVVVEGKPGEGTSHDVCTSSLPAGGMVGWPHTGHFLHYFLL